MNPILKNILAVLAGIIVGSIVNMALIMTSHLVIPYPEGMIPGDMESLAAHIGDFEAKHFLMPFLAHALGTLAGAFTVSKITDKHQLKFALGIAFWFLIGGITMVIDLPSPTWFIIADLALAYFPMGFLGYKLAVRK